MARSGIKNISSGPITLPLPLHGILEPNKKVISSLSTAALATLFNSANLIKQVRIADLDNVGDVTTGLEGNVSMAGVKITDLGAPTANTDAATKAYVDDAGPASGLLYTPAVTGNWPGTDPADAADALDRLAARTLTMQVRREKVSADSADADATAAFTIGRLPIAGIITAARFIPDAALTAHDTHYGTLIVTKGDGTGGVATAVASQTTKITGGSGDWTANKLVSLGTISNPTCAAGTVIGGEITKAGNGVAVPAGIWEVDYTPASGA